MPPPDRLPHLPEALAGLEELALDLRWSWSVADEALWRDLDPETWALTRNPWLLLQTASTTRLAELAEDRDYRARLAAAGEAHRRALAGPTWFQRAHPEAPLGAVAYLSLEFGLSEALPIYSGGLGVLAGDHMKAASDLGVPVVGIGLLYQRGYFRQVIDHQGDQAELFTFNDPSQLPIRPLRAADGSWVRLPLDPPGRVLWLRIWEAQVGRVRLYLLDGNDPLNAPADRGITGELYGGGSRLRLEQELVLGWGAVALLRSLGLRPEVFHLNEGHAAFAVLARAWLFMRETGLSFEAALAATRPGNLFTTHTPVAAGFDRFDIPLAARYLGPLAERLGIPFERLLALGRENPDDRREPFNMAWLAIRGSGAVNGVSRLHGRVSRSLFQPLFPRRPPEEVPVESLTNGVHVPTWEAAEIGEALDEHCGADRWLGELDTIEERLRGLPDERLWEVRARQRRALVGFARQRLARERGAAAESPERIAQAARALDPNALTLGFARRFAVYKRPTLLLRDPDRLARLLRDPKRPVQIVVAGKAHPRDEAGKAMIAAWTAFARRADVEGRAVFVADYDLLLAERLVQGVDVWLNTPRRPWEASGTSGMKVLANGGINLSVRDGWWAEAWSPEVGWALGDGRSHDGDPAWDDAEALELYRILEEEVVPAFYDRDEAGIPRRWTRRMRESMATLTPRFSTNRMVREYTERFYLPGAARQRRRAGDQGKAAVELVAWRARLAAHWGGIRVGRVDVAAGAGAQVFEAQVALGDLPAEDVRVELFAAPASGGGAPVVVAMSRTRPLTGATNAFLYEAAVGTERPAGDYTVRVVPFHPDASIPLEAESILWSR